MIEDSFHDFFLATAGAAAALIGLLFVAVSVAPERVVDPNAEIIHQIRASAALSALVSTLTLSLIALLPKTNIGWPAIVIGGSGVVYVAATLRRVLAAPDSPATKRRSLTLLIGFLAVMVLETVSGIRLELHSHNSGAVTAVAAGAIALLAIGIARSWELVGGRSKGLSGNVRELMAHGEHPADDE